jgi:hypothetical protein
MRIPPGDFHKPIPCEFHIAAFGMFELNWIYLFSSMNSSSDAVARAVLHRRRLLQARGVHCVYDQ